MEALVKAGSDYISDPVNFAHKYFKRSQSSIFVQDGNTGDFKMSISRDDLENNYEDILDLPERLAKKRKFTFVICLDEFQHIIKS